MIKYRVFLLFVYVYLCVCFCVLLCLCWYFINLYFISFDDKVLNEVCFYDFYLRGMILNCRKIVNGIVFLCFEVIEVVCGVEGDWCYCEVRIV